MGDGLLDAALLARYEGSRCGPRIQRWPDWTQGPAEEDRWRARRSLRPRPGRCGGKLTLGTITIGCALGYLDFRFGNHNWRAKRPKLAKWLTTFSKLPPTEATVPPPAWELA